MFPDFFLVGAAKSGTSSAFSFLGQHPQIFTSARKEPNYFALAGQSGCFAGPGDERVAELSILNRDEYEGLFCGVRDEVAVGEASTLYLYSEIAAQRIQQACPQARILAILRNPVDRALSSYGHLRRDGREPSPTFAEALAEEPRRRAANWEHLWHYRKAGLYSEQIRRYVSLFPAEQISVHLYDDFNLQPHQVLREMFEFLQVDPAFVPSLSHSRNVTGRVRSRRFQELIGRQSSLKRLVQMILPARLRSTLYHRLEGWNVEPAQATASEDERRLLSEYFRPDLLQLQDLLKRDLSLWMT